MYKDGKNLVKNNKCIKINKVIPKEAILIFHKKHQLVYIIIIWKNINTVLYICFHKYGIY